MHNADIGIKIVSYKSIADAVKIIRKYTGQSISEIKSAIDQDELVYSGEHGSYCTQRLPVKDDLISCH